MFSNCRRLHLMPELLRACQQGREAQAELESALQSSRVGLAQQRQSGELRQPELFASAQMSRRSMSVAQVNSGRSSIEQEEPQVLEIRASLF